MLELLAAIGIISDIAGGVSAKNDADKAAAAAKEVGEFNAKIIERDLTILENQRKIINANAKLDEKIARHKFSGVQGSVVAGYGAAGIDIASGTPMRVLRQNAREFEYDLKVADFNNALTNLQITDTKRGIELSAELSRMEGGNVAAAYQAQGRASLLSGFGSAAQRSYSTGIFDKSRNTTSSTGIFSL